MTTRSASSTLLNLTYDQRWTIAGLLAGRSFGGVVREHVARVLGLPPVTANRRSTPYKRDTAPDFRVAFRESEWRAIDAVVEASGQTLAAWVRAAVRGAFFAHSRWTPGEDLLLELHWRELPRATLRAWLPAHTPGAIYARAAHRLKLSATPEVGWVPRAELVRSIPRPRWLVLGLCAALETRGWPRRVFIRAGDAARVAREALAKRTVSDLAPALGYSRDYVYARMRAAGIAPAPGHDLYATLEEACAACGLTPPREVIRVA